MINKLFFKTKIKDKDIKDMNEKEAFPLIEIEGNYQFNEKIKIAILGNSITYHPSAEEIGWNRVSGMASSSVEKDYVSLLFKKLCKNYRKQISLKLTNYALFERFGEKSYVEELKEFSPDIIIFQLGENTGQNLLEFKKNYISLINEFKENSNIKSIVTTPFFPSHEKNVIIRDVCQKTESFLVDLSHLVLTDERNYAKTEFKYKHKGIGIHPGDFGMNNISELIFTMIKAIKK